MTAGKELADAPLTVDEQTELGRLEDVVERGLDTFVEVGQALARIRDGRLYRQTHLSFERYLTDRWDLSRSRAHRLIEAAQITEMLPVGNKPANERQARELTGLSADEATGVMAIATGNGTKKATGNNIAAARSQVIDTEFFDSPSEAADAAAMGSLDEAEFDDVLQKARTDGDLSREHVADLSRRSHRPRPRQKPLPAVAQDAGYELRKAVERIDRIVSDARYPANKKQVALALRGHLLYAQDTVAAVLEQFAGDAE